MFTILETAAANVYKYWRLQIFQQQISKESLTSKNHLLVFNIIARGPPVKRISRQTKMPETR